MEKVLLINIDYSAVNRTLEKMNYDTDVFICQGDKIVLSNGRYSSIGKEFQTFDQTGRVGYCQELEFYGMDLDIYVMQPKRQLWTEIPAADWILNCCKCDSATPSGAGI